MRTCETNRQSIGYLSHPALACVLLIKEGNSRDLISSYVHLHAIRAAIVPKYVAHRGTSSTRFREFHLECNIRGLVHAFPVVNANSSTDPAVIIGRDEKMRKMQPDWMASWDKSGNILRAHHRIGR
jgi:hypothetical protein